MPFASLKSFNQKKKKKISIEKPYRNSSKCEMNVSHLGHYCTEQETL